MLAAAQNQPIPHQKVLAKKTACQHSCLEKQKPTACRSSCKASVEGRFINSKCRRLFGLPGDEDEQLNVVLFLEVKLKEN